MVAGQGGETETVVLEDSDDQAGPVAPKRGRKRRAQPVETDPQDDRSSAAGPGGGIPDIAPPRREVTDDAAVEALAHEVATMKAALDDLRGRETYIVQGRSRKHHRIGVPESANLPASWSTVCGWRYGTGYFHRASWVGDSDVRCGRCFPECFDRTAGSEGESADSADSDSDSRESSSSSSDSS